MGDYITAEKPHEIVHTALHCLTCKNSNKGLVGKGPCCSLPTIPRIQYPKVCLDHEEE